MKKFTAILLAVLSAASLAIAHEMKGGSTKGLLGLKAEYVHVLLNPLPVYGLLTGALVLAAALLTRSNGARNISLVIIVLCAASAWPVLLYGQHGYNELFRLLDTEFQQWLDVHMNRAEHFIYAFYVTALLGIAALVLQKRFQRAAKALTLLTLLSAIVSLGIGAWISRAGGMVSHSEFRNGPPPAPAADHQHDSREHSEEAETNRNR